MQVVAELLASVEPVPIPQVPPSAAIYLDVIYAHSCDGLAAAEVADDPRAARRRT